MAIYEMEILVRFEAGDDVAAVTLAAELADPIDRIIEGLEGRENGRQWGLEEIIVPPGEEPRATFGTDPNRRKVDLDEHEELLRELDRARGYIDVTDEPE